jgi:activating signal cointegrator 1
MKALSLRQPWATLLATGVKQWETRSWRAPENMLGQTFLIHASSTFDHFEREFARSRDVLPLLHEVGYDVDDLPLGAIIGLAMLCEIQRTENVAYQLTLDTALLGVETHRLTERERMLGDWRVGRWAFRCSHAREFESPIPYNGQLKFFETTFSDAILNRE